MMKKIIFLMIAVLLVAGAMACPSEQVFKLELKKGLFNYLSNPEQSRLTFYEVKDLISIYLSTDDTSTLDCNSIIGNESGIAASVILSKADSIDSAVIPKCSDGTYYGDCSATRPKFCYSGMLKYMCYGPDLVIGNDDDCGCPEKYDICENDGSCRTPTISCFYDEDCGKSTYVGSNYCNKNDVYRDYVNFTCNNPGTAGAYCSYDNESLLVEQCNKSCKSGSCS